MPGVEGPVVREGRELGEVAEAQRAGAAVMPLGVVTRTPFPVRTMKNLASAASGDFALKAALGLALPPARCAARGHARLGLCCG